ncbi:MAG: AmmeMemoRadiSam system protein B, partial [Thermodesulfobacteriota bacterium]
MNVRKPVFAGSWYPNNPDACRKQIETFVLQTRFRSRLEGEKKAGIVPHAGWPFSGELACSVFVQISKYLSPSPP